MLRCLPPVRHWSRRLVIGQSSSDTSAGYGSNDSSSWWQRAMSSSKGKRRRERESEDESLPARSRDWSPGERRAESEASASSSGEPHRDDHSSTEETCTSSLSSPEREVSLRWRARPPRRRSARLEKRRRWQQQQPQPPPQQPPPTAVAPPPPPPQPVVQLPIVPTFVSIPLQEMRATEQNLLLQLAQNLQGQICRVLQQDSLLRRSMEALFSQILRLRLVEPSQQVVFQRWLDLARMMSEAEEKEQERNRPWMVGQPVESSARAPSPPM